MNVSYETQGFNTYLVYELDPPEQINTTALGMITNNQIPGFCPALYTQLDNKRYLKYLVTAKVTATNLFDSVMSKKQLISFLSSVSTAMKEADDYMIDISSLLLSLDSIFVDVATCRGSLICLPVMGNQAVDVNAFFRNIVVSAKYDPSENKDYVGELISYFGSSTAFIPGDFLGVLKKLEGHRPDLFTPQPPLTPAPPQIINENMASRPQPVPNAPAPNVRTVPPPAPKRIKPAVPKIDDHAATEPDEPPMSLFYLLQHYNSENKAIYDRQQQRKKEAKGKASPPKEKAQKPVKNKKAAPSPAAGYAIPGQQQGVNSQPAVPSAIPVNSAAPAPPQPVSQPAPMREQAPIQEPVYAAPSGGDMGFGQTVYIDNADEDSGTVFMEQPESQIQNPQLIRKRNQECIKITKPLFRIGRAANYSDYVVTGNAHVGNAHGHIIIRDGKYFIVDDNSKNHTYVNGGMIPSSTEISLNHGDSLLFADEEFEFRLY